MSDREISGDIVALADIFALYARAMMQIEPHRAPAIIDALNIMRDGYEENGNTKAIAVIDYIITKIDQGCSDEAALR